jgi:hypothetical protein
MSFAAQAAPVLERASQDGFISAADRAMLAANLGPAGNAAFTGWLQQQGIDVREQPVMDEENTEGGLGALGRFGATPEESRAYAQDYRGLLEQQAAAAQSAAEARREAYEQGRRQILQNPYGAPSTRERLFGLANTLLSPRSMPGWKGTLSNITGHLGQNEQAQRGAEEQRAAALAQLQQQYAQQGSEAEAAALRDRLSSMASGRQMFEQQPEPRARMVWSENLQRFVSPDRAEIVASRIIQGGARADRMSDGTTRITATNGEVRYYDAGGNPIIEGAAR